MKFKDWMHKIIETGNLCSSYTDKVSNARSKKEIMDIVLDANGSTYLQEMQKIGIELPYEVIMKEFRSFINGKYKPVFRNEKGNGYSSAMYCCYSEDDSIAIDTTMTIILGCNSILKIKDNDFVRICADKNCNVKIECPKSSKCIIEFWDGAKIDTSNSEGDVKLVKH